MDAVVGRVRRWWWRRGHQRFYASEAGRTDAYALNAGTRAAFDAMITELRRTLDAAPDDTVLDIGGGNGCVSAAVFPECRRRIVLDRCHPQGASADAFVVGDMMAPPFSPASFTTLFSYSTFPHVGSTAAAASMLRTWDALLAPGGTLYIGDIPDRMRLGVALARGLTRLPRLAGLKYYVSVGLISSFSKKALKGHLESLGYDVRILDQSARRRFHRERFDLIARKGRL